METTNRKLLMGILLAVCVVCVFSLPAAAATNSTVSGTYIAGAMRAGNNSEFITSLIQYDCDGNGAMTRQILAQSESGTVAGADVYSVATDGMMTTGSASNKMRGVVSSDGVFFVINSTVTGGTTEMHFAVKQSSGMANKKMTGKYAMMVYTLSDPAGQSGMYEAVCDGDGNMSATLIVPGAAQTSLSDTISGAYSVSGNGRMAFAQNGLTVPDQGAISSDGEIFVLVGVGTNQGARPYFCLGIRQGSSAKLSDFNGDFYYDEVLAESGGTATKGYVSAVKVDGNGNFRLAELYDNCGCPLKSDSFNFTMNGNGRMLIDGIKTGVLASGKIIFALIGYEYENDAFLGIGILKSTDTPDNGNTDSGGGGGGCFVKTAGE